MTPVLLFPFQSCQINGANLAAIFFDKNIFWRFGSNFGNGDDVAFLKAFLTRTILTVSFDFHAILSSLFTLSSLLSLLSLLSLFPSFSLLHFLQFLVSLSLLLSPLSFLLSFSLVLVSILFLSFSPIPTTHTQSQGKDVNSSQFPETGRHQPVSESQSASASASPMLIRKEIMLGINSGSKLNRELTPPTFFSLTNYFKDYFPQIDPLLSSHPYRLSKFTWYYPG